MRIVWLAPLVEARLDHFRPLLEEVRNDPSLGPFLSVWWTTPGRARPAFALGLAEVSNAQWTRIASDGRLIALRRSDETLLLKTLPLDVRTRLHREAQNAGVSADMNAPVGDTLRGLLAKIQALPGGATDALAVLEARLRRDFSV